MFYQGVMDVSPAQNVEFDILRAKTGFFARCGGRGGKFLDSKDVGGTFYHYQGI